jgi:hypothetical protein
VARNEVSISIKPTIGSPKNPIKAWQTEECVEGPRPPDLPGYKEVSVGTRFQFPARSQYYDIVQQILWRDLQVPIGGSGLQVFEGKASLFDNILP